MAAPRKSTDNTEFKSLQFFFAPAHRTRTDTHTAHGADGTLAQNSAGKVGNELGKSAAPVSRTTLRTRDRAAMGFLVTTTSRHSGIAAPRRLHLRPVRLVLNCVAGGHGMPFAFGSRVQITSSRTTARALTRIKAQVNSMVVVDLVARSL